MRAVVVYEIIGNGSEVRDELLQMVEDLNDKWYKNKRIVYVDFVDISKTVEDKINKTNEKNYRNN